MKATYIYFTNGVDFIVPKDVIIVYLYCVFKWVAFWFLMTNILLVPYNLAWFALSVWWGDYKFFTDVINEQLFPD